MEEQVFIGIPSIDRLRVKKPTNIDPVRSLVVPFAYDFSVRKKPSSFLNIEEAYKEDGYFKRAILRYVQLGFSEGFTLIGSDRVVKYLEQRLRIAANLDGTSPLNYCRALFRDYVKMGNVVLLKAYSNKLSTLSGYKLTPRVSLGLFPISVSTLTPLFDKTGNQVKWLYRDSNSMGQEIVREFNLEDVILLTYDKPPSSPFGTPAFSSVVPDIMAERQIEESILKLVYKYPNPIIHIETPPMGSDKDNAVAEDMMRMASTIKNMSSDSALITAPGQKVNLLGAESRALRMEEYLGAFKKRIFAGLGLNSQMIGEEVSNQKDIELDRIARDQALDFIVSFKEQFLQAIIQLFLSEAGIKEDVTIKFTDPDPLYRIKMETHLINAWNNNLLSEDEVRAEMGYPPLTPAQYQNTFLNRVKMPQLLEPAKLQASIASSSYVKKNTDSKKTRPSGASKPPSNQYTN